MKGALTVNERGRRMRVIKENKKKISIIQTRKQMERKEERGKERGNEESISESMRKILRDPEDETGRESSLGSSCLQRT